MKRRDMPLIGAALLLAAGLFALSRLTLGAPPAQVVARIGGREALRVPLGVDGRYELRQEDGSLNVLVVEDGAARIVEANCRDGLCVRQGATRSAAKAIVCLPHELVVRLEGARAADEDDLDVVL